MKKPKKFTKSKKLDAKNPKKKKSLSKAHARLKTWGLTLLLFALGSVFILGTPRVIALATQNIPLSSPNEIPQQSAPVGQVAGIQLQPIVQITSAGTPAPSFSAVAVLAQDLESGQVLFEKNNHQRLLPASTTKVMTALVALSYYKPNDILAVSADDLVGGSTMGLSAGEELSFQSLLTGMLINSGNDAASAIASNYPGGVSSFVTAMNEKAQELGLNDTHFQNPVGFDDPQQYSSAADLAKLAGIAISNPQIASIVDTKATTVSNIDGTKEHTLRNVNELLGQNGVIGIKTGSTAGAGENLIGLVERGGHKVLTVMLDSTDRFGETAKLMDWVYQNFTWKEISGQ